MYEIEIADSQQLLELDEAFLREVTGRVLADEQVLEARISVALVDNAAIHELNRQYLNHDDATDVLSFLLECEETGPPASGDEGGRPQSAAKRGAGKRLEGEVVLSVEMALESAAKFGWSPREEVILYLVHGLLHLVGYDDVTDQEQQIMRERERQFLKLWDLTPHYEASGDVPEDVPGADP